MKREQGSEESGIAATAELMRCAGYEPRDAQRADGAAARERGVRNLGGERSDGGNARRADRFRLLSFQTPQAGGAGKSG